MVPLRGGYRRCITLSSRDKVLLGGYSGEITSFTLTQHGGLPSLQNLPFHIFLTELKFSGLAVHVQGCRKLLINNKRTDARVQYIHNDTHSFVASKSIRPA